MDRKRNSKPSQERPWMKFYPPEVRNMVVPKCTLNEFIREKCPSEDTAAIHYYGNDITWKTVFDQVERTARALSAVGFGENDQIPVFFRSVPEFIFLLLAAEKIGASLLCRDNTLEENVDAVKKSGAKTIFAHDFLSRREMEAYQSEAGVEQVILLSPYYGADEKQMPEHVKKYISSLYTSDSASGKNTMSWDQFMALGEHYENEAEVPADINRPLFRAYTSGSTAASKQVIHSAYTMLGIVYQMALYGEGFSVQPTWLLTNLPPCLVAVVVSMMLTPLTSNKLLILDPFCDVFDLDLEIMRYKPNFWPHIPLFMNVLVNSPRIPEDYDMSHLWAAGAGCEATNNGQIKTIQMFLQKHNCKAVYSVAYGQSESGSICTFPCPTGPMTNGNIGIPLPMCVLAVFKPGTQEELSYNEIGEICKMGPGNMLGYDCEKTTSEALQVHEDGNVWLHTGDIGYVTEDGIFYMLTRGKTDRFDGGELIGLSMENKVVDAEIDGIIDEFFVIIPDRKHTGYFLPYMYVVLEEGYTVSDVENQINEALRPYERPVEILQIPERPFFHYKTNRVGLTKELLGNGGI